MISNPRKGKILLYLEFFKHKIYSINPNMIINCILFFAKFKKDVATRSLNLA